MNSKQIILSILTLSFLSFSIVLTRNSFYNIQQVKAESGKVLTVCPVGTAGQDGCDYIGPQGIRDAIHSDKTDANTVIYIRNGEYIFTDSDPYSTMTYQNIGISKQTIKLIRGESREHTIIKLNERIIAEDSSLKFSNITVIAMRDSAFIVVRSNVSLDTMNIENMSEMTTISSHASNLLVRNTSISSAINKVTQGGSYAVTSFEGNNANSKTEIIGSVITDLPIQSDGNFKLYSSKVLSRNKERGEVFIFLNPGEKADSRNILIENNIFEGSANRHSNDILSFGKSPTKGTSRLNITIRGNIIRSTDKRGYGINIGSELNINTLDIENNTIVANSYGMRLNSKGTHNVVRNNIIKDNSNIGFYSSKDIGISYSLFYQNGKDTKGNIIQSNILHVDPMLDESYHPKTGSPVCGAGYQGEDIGAYPCSEVSATKTPTPTINPQCLCSTNDICSSACSFNPQPSGSIKCNADSVPRGNDTLSASDKNGFCTRPLRTKGDADGRNGVTLTDYAYYLQVVLGQHVPKYVNTDFNGDGVTTFEDLNIIKSTLNGQ